MAATEVVVVGPAVAATQGNMQGGDALHSDDDQTKISHVDENGAEDRRVEDDDDNDDMGLREKTKDGAVVALAPLPRAALRRLAHDAGVRMTRESFDSVNESLAAFLRELSRHATLAMTYSRKRRICTEHVRYALQKMAVELPDELHALGDTELKNLKKCNVNASPDLRKSSPLAAEISEASFQRFLRAITLHAHGRVGFSIAARHLIHLVCEVYLVRLFAQARAGPAPYMAQAAQAAQHRQQQHHTANTLCRSLLGPATEPTEIQLNEVTKLLDTLSSQIPCLLQITSARTVDERLVQAAAGCSVAALAASTGRASSSSLRGESISVLGRVLRGQAVDKRITAGAIECLGRLLAATLQRDEGRGGAAERAGGTERTSNAG